MRSKFQKTIPTFSSKTNMFQEKSTQKKPSGKKRMTDGVGAKTVSGDLPQWLLEQENRIDPGKINEVPQDKRTWYNGGVGGAIRSVFHLDYGQISDSTVSSDVPDFMLHTSKRVCPDDVRSVPKNQCNWYNGGTKGVRSQFDLDYGHISDSTVSGDGPHFLVSLNERVCPEEVRKPKNHEMKWHNRDAAPRQLLPHEQQNHHVVYSSSPTNNHDREKVVKRNKTKTGMVHEAALSDWHQRKTMAHSSYSTPNLHDAKAPSSYSCYRAVSFKREGVTGSLNGANVNVFRGNEDPLQIQKLKRLPDNPAQRSNITCW